MQCMPLHPPSPLVLSASLLPLRITERRTGGRAGRPGAWPRKGPGGRRQEDGREAPVVGGNGVRHQSGWRCFHASPLLSTPSPSALLALPPSITLDPLSFPTSVSTYCCMVALERTTVLSQCCPPVSAGREGGKEGGRGALDHESFAAYASSLQKTVAGLLTLDECSHCSCHCSCLCQTALSIQPALSSLPPSPPPSLLTHRRALCGCSLDSASASPPTPEPARAACADRLLFPFPHP